MDEAEPYPSSGKIELSDGGWVTLVQTDPNVFKIGNSGSGGTALPHIMFTARQKLEGFENLDVGEFAESRIADNVSFSVRVGEVTFTAYKGLVIEAPDMDAAKDVISKIEMNGSFTPNSNESHDIEEDEDIEE
jgi:hypothetical protein